MFARVWRLTSPRTPAYFRAAADGIDDRRWDLGKLREGTNALCGDLPARQGVGYVHCAMWWDDSLGSQAHSVHLLAPSRDHVREMS